jgi:nitrogen fixation protein NifU and related proteins
VSLKDNLYKEVILDHNQNPRNFGVLEPSTLHEMGVNPLCGDEFELFMNIENDMVKQARFQGKGCSISRASASIMVDLVEGKTITEVSNLIKKFKGMFLDDTMPDFTEEEEDLESLSSVKKVPVRVKCAVLSWNTLEKALKDSGRL